MVGPAVIGYEPRKHALPELVKQPELTFVKTHRQPHRVECGDQPAIYLVRDGRDAIVSFAHQRADGPKQQGQSADVHQLMLELIVGETLGTGNWGLNVLSWLRRSPPPVLVRFERLICEPERELGRALAELGLEPPKRADGAAPSFAELNAVHQDFFRRGVVGSYRDEMLPETLARFWAQPHHAEAMALLGYGSG